MSVKSSCSEAVAPRRSVAAGCSGADLCMRLYLMQATDAIIHQWPSVMLGGFVDDLQIMAVGRPLQVSLTLAGADRTVKDELENVGNLVLHPGKQVLVTNDGPTTKQVLRRCPSSAKPRPKQITWASFFVQLRVPPPASSGGSGCNQPGPGSLISNN